MGTGIFAIKKCKSCDGYGFILIRYDGIQYLSSCGFCFEKGIIETELTEAEVVAYAKEQIKAHTNIFTMPTLITGEELYIKE